MSVAKFHQYVAITSRVAKLGILHTILTRMKL